METARKKRIQVEVTNVNRALGTIFGSEITRKYPEGLSDDTFTVSRSGSGDRALAHLSQGTDPGAGRGFQ